MQWPVLFDFAWEKHPSRSLVLFLFLDLNVVFYALIVNFLFGSGYPKCYDGPGAIPLEILHWVFLLLAALASNTWNTPALLYPALLVSLVYASLSSALELPACREIAAGSIEDPFYRAFIAINAPPVLFLRIFTVIANWGAVLCLAHLVLSLIHI